MDGRLRSMTGLYLKQGERLLLLYRTGSRIIADCYAPTAGGHFEGSEVSDAKACVLRELCEETGLTENDIEGLSLRYVTLRLKNNEIRQNYYFFAELKKSVRDITSNEGRLEWFEMSALLENMPDMPYTSKYVIEHYLKTGKDNSLLYAGAAVEDGVVFTELREF